MSGWTSAAGLRRAFLTVLALRYVPTGLTLPVLVLLMIDRGLDLAQVGVAIAAMSAVVLVLEVPSGGLADAVGSRAVLASSSVLAAGALGLRSRRCCQTQASSRWCAKTGRGAACWRSPARSAEPGEP